MNGFRNGEVNEGPPSQIDEDFASEARAEVSTPGARPFQVDDRVKVTVLDPIAGGLLRIHTGTVRSIKDMTAPNVDDWASLVVDVDEPYTMATSGNEHEVAIVHLTVDRTQTTWAESEVIELLEDAPEPSIVPDFGPLGASLTDRTLAKVLSRPAHVPSPVALDEAHSAAGVIKAAMRWEETENGAPWDHAEAEMALRKAVIDYRETVS